MHFVTYFPNESDEFAGDGHLDLVMVHQALLEFFEACVETVLGLP